jgi:hypothetical protein
MQGIHVVFNIYACNDHSRSINSYRQVGLVVIYPTMPSL